MRTKKLTVLGDDLVAAAVERAYQGILPVDIRASPDTLIDLLAAVYRLEIEAMILADELSAHLDDLGFTPQACRICGRLFACRTGRRPRLYCRPQCELGSKTSAFRQRTDEVSATAAAGG